MDFWEAVWLIVISFAFFAYLMVLFSIIGDLFRDREASGFAKAAWVCALIVVPFLSSFVYLIVKGGDMARRSASSAAEVRERQDAYIKEVAGSATPGDQITQGQVLLSKGQITEAEFDTLKAKALA
jgi:hypothetical protein